MPDTLPINSGPQPDAGTLTPSVTPPQTPAYTGPNQKPSLAGHILRGILGAIAGPQQATVSVDPNTGQVTESAPQNGDTFKRMFGGILAGAMTGLAGGFDKGPGGNGGGAASLARGFEARQSQLQQNDQLARANALKQFQAQQEAKQTQQKQSELNLET